MNILGLSFGFAATASVMCDGKIVAAASEERFTRRKNDEGYPYFAIEDCLFQTGLSASDLDLVVISGETLNLRLWVTKSISSFSMDDQMRAQKEYWYPLLNEDKNVSWFEVFSDKVNFDQYPARMKDVYAGIDDLCRVLNPGGYAFIMLYRSES